MSGLGGGSGYKPRVCCIDCKHHVELNKKNWFGRIKTKHICYVDVKKRDYVTGVCLNIVRDCYENNGAINCRPLLLIQHELPPGDE